MAAPQLKVVVNNQEAMILQIAPMKISTEKGIFLLNYSMQKNSKTGPGKTKKYQTKYRMIFRYFAQILLHRPDLYWTTYRIYPQCNVPQFFSSFHQTGCNLFHFFYGKITGASGAKLRHTHVVLFWFVHTEITLRTKKRDCRNNLFILL